MTEGHITLNQPNGALYPYNSTVDLLIGGQSTSSAKFAITNINGARGTQVATLSGNIVLDTAGSLQTTKEPHHQDKAKPIAKKQSKQSNYEELEM
jgi:hypothetical protein